MNPGKLNKRIEIWRNQAIKNRLGENDIEPVLLKKLWANIVPQTGTVQRAQVETKLSNVTEKMVIRYSSGKDILPSDFVMFKGRRRDIKYILNPYEANVTLELFCEDVVE